MSSTTSPASGRFVATRLRGLPGALLTVLVVVAGALITLLAARATARAEQHNARTALAVHAGDIENEIKAHLLAYEGLLHAGAGLIDTLWPVSPEQWRSFAAQLRLAAAYPGIHGIGFSVALRSPKEADLWRERIAPSPLHQFPRSTSISHESAIVLVEPMDARNQRVLGFDMMSEPARRAAMERARDEGAPALSGPVTLIQQLHLRKPDPGFVLNVPVYATRGVPAHLSERRREFRGVVYSAFRANEFFGSTLRVAPSEAIFEVFDGDASRGQLLYRNAAPPTVEPMMDVRQFDVAVRDWTLRVYLGAARQAPPRAALLVASTGFALTLLLAAIVAMLALSRQNLHARMEASRAHADRERVLNEELERRVAERTGELEQANRQLSAANRELETFTYTVSHDLRAPLRAVNGHVELFVQSATAEASEEQRRHLDAIRRNVSRMAQMIEDLLKLAFVGRRPLEKERVSIAELVKPLAEEIERHHAVDIEVRAEDLGYALVDAALLRQVFTNLLGNAAKFSRHAQAPRVYVGADERDGERVYYVRDNGVGFDMQYAGKLFGVFERLHSAREFEGSGVGLAIVKQIVERHDGRVWAQAQPGQGAVFYFTLGDRPSSGAIYAIAA